MKPILSIIIPCYNSEATLEETLMSVRAQDFDNWEAIIVNDGSPDNLEAIALKWVAKDNRFKYHTKQNGGLGTARNFGISKAIGEFILPLDSDNMVRPDFAKKAIDILKKDNNLGVVYGDAMYFGEKEWVWKVGAFSIHKMLNSNFIDACSIIRKSVFVKGVCYDEDMPYQGLEDWDLWLTLIGLKHNFYYLEEITFDYRVSKSSMIKSFTNNMRMESIKYLKSKHWKLYLKALFLIPDDNNNYIWLKRLKRKIKFKGF